MNENGIDLRKVSDEAIRGPELQKREDALTTAGFSPAFISDLRESKATLYTEENITQKITDLKALGFTDPTKMITSLPAILGLNIENITQKITDLKALGFTDPTKMITSSPTILGLNIENITRKFGTLENIFQLYGMPIDAKEFVESNLSVLGTKIDKLWIVARALRTLNLDSREITPAFLSRLLFSNVTNSVASAVSLSDTSGAKITQTQLLKAIQEAKKIPQVEKELIIKKTNSKLAQRYRRGYGAQE